MAAASHIDPLLSRLRGLHGVERHFGRSKRLYQFGSDFTCSINYSKELRGGKFFFGLSTEVLDHRTRLPATKHGHFVVLICAQESAALWLPRGVILQAMTGVTSGKLDVFMEDGRYILQTTGHPKLDVTDYLGAMPAPAQRASAAATLPPEAIRSHFEIQLGLTKIGVAEGCRVWVPPGDRNLTWKDEALRDLTCDRLPNFGFDENTRRVVSNIDVLWLHGNVIRHAFEIEATTSIYSGLLRLNDLTLAQPNNHIALCIVADAAREPRVIGQMMRPTFQMLRDRCSFLPFDQVRDGAAEIERLKKRGITRVEGLVKVKALTLPARSALDPIDLQS